jgi:hypothetical protein
MEDVCRGRCELVWDSGGTGTAESPGGALLEIAEFGEWTPGRLLNLAAQSSVMFEFLRLAEEEVLEVLGYVSSGEVSLSSIGEEEGRLILSPCIVVRDDTDAGRARSLLEEAMASSPICCAFRGERTLDPRLIVALRRSA